jgi:hypothetical protein
MVVLRGKSSRYVLSSLNSRLFLVASAPVRSPNLPSPAFSFIVDRSLRAGLKKGITVSINWAPSATGTGTSTTL